ncbi:telomere repeat-binding factor 1-like isoform X2 [Lactuca sativa]|uniref:telomere repeat-binding factor 1-like isoform X2 n=1 Tax=Lactuca sativa TaxID=4236 RepID=UPI000CD9B140|nr:telomere repeat-binding factor 1-like isoform X2 [Lactuca sativa]XP_042754746.1 telomere repeat-binding factor 1-like isoform X2 [Lactuca sativa]
MEKWRNMSVMANGWGSREKARLALKRVQHVPKDDNPLSLTTVDPSDKDSGDVRPLQSSSGSPQVGASKRSMIRLDNLIMVAINNLKEHGGSNKTTIGTYIELPLFEVKGIYVNGPEEKKRENCILRSGRLTRGTILLIYYDTRYVLSIFIYYGLFVCSDYLCIIFLFSQITQV